MAQSTPSDSRIVVVKIHDGDGVSIGVIVDGKLVYQSKFVISGNISHCKKRIERKFKLYRDDNELVLSITAINNFDYITNEMLDYIVSKHGKDTIHINSDFDDPLNSEFRVGITNYRSTCTAGMV